MPKRGGNVKNASRYATVSVPSTKKVVEEKKEVVEVEKVIVDPYSYFTTQTVYLDRQLTEKDIVGMFVRYDLGYSSCGLPMSSVTANYLGTEEVETNLYTHTHDYFAGSRKMVKIIVGSESTFIDNGNHYLIKKGCVLSAFGGYIDYMPHGKREMHAYTFTYKYLPNELSKGGVSNLVLQKDGLSMFLGQIN